MQLDRIVAMPTHFKRLLLLTISNNFLELRDLRSLTGNDYLLQVGDR
ncbi:hypothetical protein [uncultured Nostoc sp.]|nr:hypothetical protein [uncultured Nostoc sp.]